MTENNSSIRLKELRKESNLTQEHLAQYLGIDQTTVAKLENGSRNLNVTMIEKLCSLFGCSEKYLMGADESYIPLNFAFRTNGIQAEDMESIAAVNRIMMNLRFMNRAMEDK